MPDDLDAAKERETGDIPGTRGPRRVGQMPGLDVREDFGTPLPATVFIGDAKGNGSTGDDDERVIREAEVDEHVAAGRVTVHDDSEAFIAHLDRLDTETDDVAQDAAAATPLGRFVGGDPARLTAEDLERAAAAAKDLGDPGVMRSAWD